MCEILLVLILELNFGWEFMCFCGCYNRGDFRKFRYESRKMRLEGKLENV